MKLDHIGVVVKDLEVAKQNYEKQYGFNPLSLIIDEPEQKVKILFIETGQDGSPSIELIQPVSEDSAVFHFLKKTGGGLHHLSYEVKNLDKAIEHFKSLKALMIGKVYPGAGHKGQRVVWFYTVMKELIELIEEKNNG